jgi:hypothetical protein
MDFIPLVKHTSPSVCAQIAKNSTTKVFIIDTSGLSCAQATPDPGDSKLKSALTKILSRRL